MVERVWEALRAWGTRGAVENAAAEMRVGAEQELVVDEVLARIADRDQHVTAADSAA